MKKIKLLLIGFLIGFTQVSCLKKQNIEDSGLGPALDANVIQNQMFEAVGEANLSDINTNESSTLLAATTFEDSQTVKIFSQFLIVDSITSQTINLNYNLTDYLSPEQSFSNQRYTINLGAAQLKQASQSAVYSQSLLKTHSVSQKNENVPTFLIAEYDYMASAACRIKNVTCHNLTTSVETVTLSPSLADPRICSNTLNCSVPMSRIEFDLINNNDIQPDGSPKRIHYTFIVAKPLPFFSKVLQYCARHLVEMNGRMVLAEQCLSVNDFAMGD